MKLFRTITLLALLSAIISGCQLEEFLKTSEEERVSTQDDNEVITVDETRYTVAADAIDLTNDQALDILISSMSTFDEANTKILARYEDFAILEEVSPLPGDFRLNRALAPAGFDTITWLSDAILSLFTRKSASGAPLIYHTNRNENVIDYKIDPAVCEGDADCELIVNNLELVQSLSSDNSGRLDIKFTAELADFIGLKVGGGIWQFAGYSNDQWVIDIEMVSMWQLYAAIEHAGSGAKILVPEKALGRVRYVIDDKASSDEYMATYAIVDEVDVKGMTGSLEDDHFVANYSPGNLVQLTASKAEDAYFVKVDISTFVVELVLHDHSADGSPYRKMWTGTGGQAQMKGNVTLKRGVFSDYKIGMITTYVNDNKDQTYETTVIDMTTESAAHHHGNDILIGGRGVDHLEGKTVELKFVRSGADSATDANTYYQLVDVQFDSHAEVYMEAFRLGNNSDEAGSLTLVFPHLTQIAQQPGTVEDQLDDNGRPVLDDDGNTVQVFVPGPLMLKSDDAVTLTGNGALDVNFSTDNSAGLIPNIKISKSGLTLEGVEPDEIDVR